MKILYLKLKNFANIFTAVNKKEITLDLSKSKNKIVLFIGKNGSGKTSLLSELHPFATAGSMDMRNDTCLILEGTDGYKEIHLKDNDDIYVIKHHYNFSGSGKTMKSYIAKNKVELNPNGNVTSFKELVKLHLGLEQELLRLMRLGSNVSSLIDMKASSRKSFATDLFQDIDIYSSFHKKVSEEYRVLRSLIKSVVSKIEKLRIIDKEETDKIIESLHRRIESINLDKRKLIENRAVILSKQNQYEELYKLSELPDTKQELMMKEKDLNSLDKQIKKILSEIDLIVSLNSMDAYILNIQEEINTISISIEVNKGTVNSSFKILDLLYKQKESNTKILNSYMSVEREKEIVDMLDILLLDTRQMERRFTDFNPTYTKESLMFLLSHLQNLDNIINDMNQFNDNAIKEVIDVFQKGHSVESIVIDNIKALNREKNAINMEISKLEDNSVGMGALIMYKPSGCVSEDCPYIEYYNSSRKGSSSNLLSLKGRLQSVENKIEYYESYMDIQDVLYNIRKYIEMNKSYMDIIPDLDLSFKTVLGKVLIKESYYSEDDITNKISELEDFAVYISNTEKIKGIQKELSEANSEADRVKNIQKELSEIEYEIMNNEAEVKKLNRDIYENEEMKHIKEKELKNLVELNSLQEKKKLVYKEYKELENDYVFKKGKEKELSQVRYELMDIDRLISSFDKELGNLNKELKDFSFRVQEFTNLNDERKYLECKFDDISILKEALSSNKGIPLLYLQLYLKNCTITMNQLLDIIYNGSLEVCDFKIDDKEFKIPYTKNGLTVSDVIYSSQGERSFISLVLSLALIIQTIEKYNIMLLDEVDATLDSRNRQVFLNLIEKLIDRTNAEQVFMISHNNMFDNYPVDVVLTSEADIDNLKNVNIIHEN